MATLHKHAKSNCSCKMAKQKKKLTHRVVNAMPCTCIHLFTLQNKFVSMYMYQAMKGKILLALHSMHVLLKRGKNVFRPGIFLQATEKSFQCFSKYINILSQESLCHQFSLTLNNVRGAPVLPEEFSC